MSQLIQLIMCNCSPNIAENGLESSDYIAILAIIVSILTFINTIRNNYKSKRIEILHSEFNNICIKNVDTILHGLDMIFKEKELESVINYRVQITAISVELQCFVISLRNSVYPQINVERFVRIIEVFTDRIYSSNEAIILDFKGDYYITKLNVYNSLYEHAIQKEFQIRYNPKSNIWNWILAVLLSLKNKLYGSLNNILNRFRRVNR